MLSNPQSLQITIGLFTRLTSSATDSFGPAPPLFVKAIPSSRGETQAREWRPRSHSPGERELIRPFGRLTTVWLTAPYLLGARLVVTTAGLDRLQFVLETLASADRVWLQSRLSSLTLEHRQFTRQTSQITLVRRSTIQEKKSSDEKEKKRLSPAAHLQFETRPRAPSRHYGKSTTWLNPVAWKTSCNPRDLQAPSRTPKPFDATQIFFLFAPSFD